MYLTRVHTGVFAHALPCSEACICALLFTPLYDQATDPHEQVQGIECQHTLTCDDFSWPCMQRTSYALDIMQFDLLFYNSCQIVAPEDQAADAETVHSLLAEHNMWRKLFTLYYTSGSTVVSKTAANSQAQQKGCK